METKSNNSDKENRLWNKSHPNICQATNMAGFDKLLLYLIKNR